MAAAPSFAAVGHQDDWAKIGAIVRSMRPAVMHNLSTDDLREIVPWLPARTVCRLSVAAEDGGDRVEGIYIDTFITPDDLAVPPTRRLIEKVHDAIVAAEREGVAVASLGGFTSILLEGHAYKHSGQVILTTGNSLTAALIVRGLERAAALLGRRMSEETVLVIGATGDVGSACTRWLCPRVGKLLLAARNSERLAREAQGLSECPVKYSTDVSQLLSSATMVVAAASSPAPSFRLEDCRRDAIVCDAGYPKNLDVGGANPARFFWGGMGVIGGGLVGKGPLLDQFYSFPVRDVAHGCLLEGAVLAMAGRLEPFSSGRGQISPSQMDEIWMLAQANGVRLAPLFNAGGVWPEEGRR